ncbi:MAG: carbohydrate kinase [Bacteroidaceae bacterium]|nr:carbohydrate kinase [Bacteroidaceae bacterium]
MENLIVGMGEALWDVLPEGKKIGGAPANFAYHVSQFGLNSCVVSAVGDDELGREIVRSFDEKCLTHCIEVVGYPTGTVQVTLDGKGVPQYDICEGVAWDNIPYSPRLAELAKQTRAVCFGSLAQRNEVSRSTILRFLESMPKTEKTLVVFDVNLRQHFYTKEILDNGMRHCNILKINDEEIEKVARMWDFEGWNDTVEAGALRQLQHDACMTLLEVYDLKMVILTCGTDGSYVFTKGAVSFRETPAVEVADTVGAGDSFTGSFIASIIKGKSIEEAHKTAVEVSAFVCTQNGAMPTLPEHFM